MPDFFHLLPPRDTFAARTRMERRRRSHRACASGPSMLSSSRGSPELRRRSASDAEVSAVAEGATGSEAAPPGDRGGRTRGGGRGSAATTSSTGGEAEGAERRGDTPARKPDPEAGRMDHHQLGTGRYQVVSTRAPGPPRGARAALSPAGPRSHLRATLGSTGRATRRDHATTSWPPRGARAAPIPAPARPFPPGPPLFQPLAAPDGLLRTKSPSPSSPTCPGLCFSSCRVVSFFPD